jgi:hypothetical protein
MVRDARADRALREEAEVMDALRFQSSGERHRSATNSVSFLGLSPANACKTVSSFVRFHRGATKSGNLFLVSIERGTSRRPYRGRPRLSDMSRLGGVLTFGSLPVLAVAHVGLSDVCRTDALVP